MNDLSSDLSSDAEIRNTKGLHARAAAKFCKTAGLFNADVKVSKGGTEVSGSSIMGLMMLAAGIGTTINIRTSGPQAQEALDALCTLVGNKFDEE